MLWRATRRGHALDGESCRGAVNLRLVRAAGWRWRGGEPSPHAEGYRLWRKPKFNLACLSLEAAAAAPTFLFAARFAWR